MCGVCGEDLCCGVNRPNTSEAKRLAKHLRKKVPAALPVKLRFVDLDDRYGDCSIVNGEKPHFVVRIHKDLNSAASVMVLVHEWAHAVAWTAEHTLLEDHGPEWGIAYARIWRCYAGEPV